MKRHVSTRAIPVVLLVSTLLPAGDGPRASSADLSQQPRVHRVRIALVGMDPFSIQVPAGARVTFINNDPHFAHHMTSPCTEVDAVGRLEPGDSGTTSPFDDSKTCEYHDSLNPGNPLRRGRIVVQ